LPTDAADIADCFVQITHALPLYTAKFVVEDKNARRLLL
jgi:hypothetical protein